MLREHKFQNLFSFILRPTLRVQLGSSAEVVCFSWRKGVLGDVHLLERKAMKAQELNLNNVASTSPLLYCINFLCPWMVDNIGVAGEGRKKNNHHLFLKSALLWLWELTAVKIRASPYSRSSMHHVLWTWKPHLGLPKAWSHLSDGHPKPKPSCE